MTSHALTLNLLRFFQVRTNKAPKTCPQCHQRKDGPSPVKPYAIATGFLHLNAEFAIVISDRFQRQGPGNQLLQLLVNIGRKEGIERIFGQILPENYGMQRVSKKVGFTVSFDRISEVMRAEMKLQPSI